MPSPPNLRQVPQHGGEIPGSLGSSAQARAMAWALDDKLGDHFFYTGKASQGTDAERQRQEGDIGNIFGSGSVAQDLVMNLVRIRGVM